MRVEFEGHVRYRYDEGWMELDLTPDEIRGLVINRGGEICLELPCKPPPRKTPVRVVLEWDL